MLGPRIVQKNINLLDTIIQQHIDLTYPFGKDYQNTEQNNLIKEVERVLHQGQIVQLEIAVRRDLSGEMEPRNLFLKAWLMWTMGTQVHLQFMEQGSKKLPGASEKD